jgi:hypothetical protein
MRRPRKVTTVNYVSTQQLTADCIWKYSFILITSLLTKHLETVNCQNPSAGSGSGPGAPPPDPDLILESVGIPGSSR